MAEEIQILLFGENKAGKTQLLHCLFFDREFDKYHGKQDARAIDPTEVLLKFDTATTASSKAPIALYCVDLSTHLNQVRIQQHIKQFCQLNPTSALFLIGTKADRCPAQHTLPKFQNLRRFLSDQGIHFADERCFVTSAWISALKKQDTFAPDPKPLVIEQGTLLVKDILDLAVYKASLNQYATRTKTLLQAALNNLSANQKKQIEAALRHLIQQLNSDAYSLENKEKAIDAFSNSCRLILQGKHPKVMATFNTILASLAIGLVMTSLICSIGVFSGLWAGPLALMHAFANGSLTTSTVAIGSGLTGLLLGGKLVSHGIFKTNKALAKIDDYASALREEKAIRL